MRRENVVMSTSLVDRHGDRIAPEALESGVEQLSRFYLPVMDEHDPRLLPRGRVVGAFIEDIADGEVALVGELELFEGGDAVPEYEEGKLLRPRFESQNKSLIFEIDRSYHVAAYSDAMIELGNLLSVEPQENVKKSIDPVSVLTVGGVFVVGAIASGFLNQLGSDAYSALKAKLSDVFQRRQSSGDDCILEFCAVIDHQGHAYEVSLLVSGPSQDDIQELFDVELQRLDEAVPGMIANQEQVQRFVFIKSSEGYRLEYAIRRDGIPLLPMDDGDDA